MMKLRRPGPRTAVSAATLLLAVSCVPLFSVPARATDPVPIAWRDDYGSALEEARAANRLVWIQFTGPWCPNCLRMEHDSFPDAEVIGHTQTSYVPLKLRSDVNEALALSFNLTGLPATVLVAPNRDVLAVHQGYLGPEELDAVLDQTLADWRGSEDLARAEDEKAKRASKAKSGADIEEPAASGYCLVSLVDDRKLVIGRAKHVVRHEGQTYRFATAAHAEAFRKAPERYIPANSGDCPVAKLDRDSSRPGDPRFGVICEGRLFLCSSAEARRTFFDDPGRYAAVDVAEQGFCPHCIVESGVLVRGEPKYSAVREGLRYWFPDESHRDAFLASFSTTETAQR